MSVATRRAVSPFSRPSSLAVAMPRMSSKRRRLLWLVPVFVIVQVAFFQRQQASSDVARSEEGQTLASSRRLLQDSDGRPDCVRPSIEDFPGDFFTQEERQQGGVVIHFIIVIYLCGVLGYICDDYFVPSLEIIAESLNVPSDVAGATFMAVGTSAPELFSSIIGSFITEGDIGLGTIVGSAVFNILGVTGVAGLAVWKNDVPIDWFPITRDCLMYAITVLALIGVISNNVVEWYEAMILILMFGAYIVVLYFNAQIEYLALLQVRELWLRAAVYQCAGDLVGPGMTPCPDESCVNDTYHYHCYDWHIKVEALRNRWFPGTVGPNPVKSNGKSMVEESTPLLGGGDEEAPAEPTARRRRDSAMSAGEERLRRDSVLLTGSVCKIVEQEEHESLWSMPDEGSVTQILWVLFWPARFLLHFTVPDCRRPSLLKWFPLTFALSVVWIGAVSYVTVWMVTIIGFTLGIPDSVAGITLLAAGTSIPEVFSSVIVARSGLGNMAICNLLGSNIFDVLFCLGVPWLFKALFASTSHEVFINSAAMTYTSVTLLSTVLLLFVIFVLTHWTLNYKVGFACVFMYVIFITLACMYELNVFGDFNPPTCT
ncbi:sodium/potassium/calcium exchanger 5 [Rhipicephalus sanguineus]|uniref:sodium/potassium/calcium exchanger 5 n=1 Tax=Rhipicephalus sanguineus TaxID=34632 RepID=UPI0018940669|nr:sodium/potassium/calcium exchanger 5 [Rhipicephalus sanguineus]